MLLFAVALSFGFASCDDDNDDDEPAPVEVNYASLIPGHWANTGLASNLSETISFNYKGAGTICFYDLVENDWGATAFGTYTLNGNKITASYNQVTVYDSNYKSGTYHGFTDGKSKTVTYTIQSCDGKELVLKDESGKMQTYKKYAEVK